MANLIGGGLMVNAYGAIHDATGSYALALMPLATLCIVAGLMVLVIGRKRQREQADLAVSVK
jgi:cyanate permease